MNLTFLQISELCTVRTGYTFRQKPVCIENGNALIIQPTNVTPDGVLKTESLERIDFPSGTNLGQNDVLLINRGRFTACVFAGGSGLPCVATSAFLILTLKNPKQILPNYLALFFNSTEGQNTLGRFNDRSSIPFISRGNLESIEIPVPPIEKQQRLIALEQAKQRFAQLTVRKVELLNNFINRQLI